MEKREIDNCCYFDIEIGCTKEFCTCEIVEDKQETLTNICVKCGVDLDYAPNFTCQEHPKNCKGIHLSKGTLKERALKEMPKQLFTKGDKVLFSGKMLDTEVVNKPVTVFYTLGSGSLQDMSDIMDEYTHVYRVWNKDLKHISKEDFGKEEPSDVFITTEQAVRIFGAKKISKLMKKGSSNIIDNWLKEQGTPEIAKQVEVEAKELCEQEKYTDVQVKSLKLNTEFVNNNYIEKIMSEFDKYQQETFEEVVERLYPYALYENDYNASQNRKRTEFIAGAKWQAERMYSEEEIKNFLYRFLEHIGNIQGKTILNIYPNEWFKQFKKK
jgi:hypothetical protein